MIKRITNEERLDKGVTGLPDTPELTTTQMQQKFDELGNMGIDKLNEVIDALNSVEEGNSGASNIAATVPAGLLASQNVQSVLEALNASITSLKQAAHTHENKAVLDAITLEVKASYDRLATMLSSINETQTVLSNRTDAIPTSAGVYRLLGEYGYQQLKLSLYPIGTLYFSENTLSPETFIGGVWERVTLIPGILSWRRVS